MSKDKITFISTGDREILVIERRADSMRYPIDEEPEYIELCGILTHIEKPWLSGKAGYLTKARRERFEWLVNYLHMMLDFEEMKRGE